MKKILISIVVLITLTACSLGNMENTPTQKVEQFLNKYQTLDEAVLNDLDTTLSLDSNLSENDKENYKEFMKKHYQDLEYEIKDETIDGDNATVEVAITVRDYTKAVSKADGYKSENKENFTDENGTYDPTLFSSYRLDELKKVTEKTTYTLNLTLVKQEGKWVLNQLTDEDLNKINGLYNG